ncbi:MAG: hypothetical protein JXA09_16970 [Anaerolineae bacterium]|nr:hypothetical protein [Anaerolineae bacterium]
MGLVVVGLWFLAGAAIEILNALSRRWTVDRLGQLSAVGWVIAGFVLRLAGTAAVLVLAFRHSARGGVAALIGYLAARWVALLWIHRQLGRAGGGT